MKKFLIATTLLCATSSVCFAETLKHTPSPQEAQVDSIQNEAQKTLQKGVNFLLSRQDKEGAWQQDPAITALCTLALFQAQNIDNPVRVKQAYEAGRMYCLKFQQKDGSFSKQGRYINYTTAVVMTTLATMNYPEDREKLLKGRHYLLGEQLTEHNINNPTDSSSPYYGGFGYGNAMKSPVDSSLKPTDKSKSFAGLTGKPPAGKGGGRGGMMAGNGADLSCTASVLEALAATEHLEGEDNPAGLKSKEKSQLAWKNAVKFVERCQSVPSENGEAWVEKADSEGYNGGFAYRPVGDKMTHATDAKTLRTYGSMTYAGVKSMIYAKLDPNDYRVKAAKGWIARNYTLEENPGMGQEGLYYYYHTLSKTYAVLGADEINLPNGQKAQWKNDLQKAVISRIQTNGSWQNSIGRWMESVPELVTAYTLLSLELSMK